jgi:inner membrane protein
VGEAVLGRKVGGKAAIWGGVAGTLPDLDVFVTPFVSETAQLGIHRGITHSVVFAVAGGIGMGRLLVALHKRAGATWRAWSLLAFLAFLTHALLDCFTMYGTQLFSPFSSYPVALSTIFIIDPLYTVPLAAGLLAALFLQRASNRRRVVNRIGLGLSTLYLLFGLANQFYMKSVFSDALDKQQLSYARLFATPTPLNNLLWMGIAEQDDHLWVGLYSLFDEDGHVRFHRIEKNTDLIAGLLDQEPVTKLLWFSRGYYTVSAEAGELYFNDLRFGRSDSWLTAVGSYVFSFRLLRHPQEPDRVTDFQRRSPNFGRDDVFSLLWERIGGNGRPGRVAPESRLRIDQDPDPTGSAHSDALPGIAP